jgi:hypothetical protein
LQTQGPKRAQNAPNNRLLLQTQYRPATGRRRRAGGAHGREHGPILASQLPTAGLGFIGGILLERCASWRVVAQIP